MRLVFAFLFFILGNYVIAADFHDGENGLDTKGPFDNNYFIPITNHDLKNAGRSLEDLGAVRIYKPARSIPSNMRFLPQFFVDTKRNGIIVGDLDSLEKLKGLIARLDEFKNQFESTYKGTIRIYRLRFNTAERVANSLKAMLHSNENCDQVSGPKSDSNTSVIAGEDIKVTVGEDKNTLIVIAPKTELKKISSMVDKLDPPSSQEHFNLPSLSKNSELDFERVISQINSETPPSSEEGLARRKTDVDQRIKEITARIEALTNNDPYISPANYKLLGEAISNLDRLPDPLELPRPSVGYIGPHGKSFWITPRSGIPEARSGESFDR